NDEDEAIVPNEYPFKDVALDKIKISNKDVDLSKLTTEERAAFDAMTKSVQSGKELFLAEGAANCGNCHIDYGRRGRYKYDDWGTLTKPANLTTGVYRGGRRPIDLYYRIHSGINPSGMTKFSEVLISKKQDGKKQVVAKDEIWDLVNFLQVLPYPAMR